MTVDGERLRRAAAVEFVVVLPVALTGVALTVSLYGIVFGVPLLVIAVPVIVFIRRVRSDPYDIESRRRLSIASVLVAVALTVALIALVVIGRDDLDSAADYAWLAVGTAWVALAWWAAISVRSAASSQAATASAAPG